MEQLKLKKVQMQGVKIILSVVITFLTFTTDCNSQSNIVGTWTDIKYMASNTDNFYLSFNENYTFEQIKYYHFGSREEKSKGRYEIYSDTLILDYIGYENPNPRQYFIKSEPLTY